jgi:hypothetical protein
MSTSLPLEQALREEKQAWRMARRMVTVARHHDEGALRREFAGFIDFLTIELEVHVDGEEADLFPCLAERGLEAEVGEAKRQHDELRVLREELMSAAFAETEVLRRKLEAIARALLRHIRYEADFLYVDLTRAEVNAFRHDVDEALEDPARSNHPRA